MAVIIITEVTKSGSGGGHYGWIDQQNMTITQYCFQQTFNDRSCTKPLFSWLNPVAGVTKLLSQVFELQVILMYAHRRHLPALKI